MIAKAFVLGTALLAGGAPATPPSARTAIDATPAVRSAVEVVPAMCVAADSSIVAFWAALDAAWNAHDAGRFSDLFATDATLVFVDRVQAHDGRAAILDNFAQQFARQDPALRHRTRVDEVREVGDGIVAVDGVVEILRVAPDAGVEPATVRTFAIFGVMQRSGDGWTIRALRVVQLPDPPQA